MKTVLVPTDFSQNATNALNYAADLVNVLGGKLILVHFINLPVSPQEGVLIVDPISQLATEYKQELDQQANTIATKFNETFSIETLCQFGNLTDKLNKVIKNKNVDLVVMGTQGASNILHKLIGTNTRDFIKVANCPVLAVPPSVQFTGIEQIAYASDFACEETIFLEQLFALAKPLRAEVSIINILPDPHLDIISENYFLRRITERFADNFYSITQIQESDVITGINKFVTENRPDILAVSIHTRSFLEDLFHKSISKELLYQMQLPLLTLPAKPYWYPFFNPANKAQNSIKS